jgi:branched-chain amino acid transport system permease protein
MDAEARRRERLNRGIKVRTETVYALLSWREIIYLLGPRAFFIVGLLVVPLLVPDLYWQRVLCLAGVYALLALAFDFLAHFVGLVCVGGAFVMGVGGYIAGLLNWYYGLPLVLTIPIATVGGALICTVVWLPCLPLRGIYFAIVTFMFPFLATSIIAALNIFGGTEGLSPIAAFPSIWVEVYLIIFLVVGLTFGLRRLGGQDIGLVFRGVKDNDQAILASGISLTSIRALALFISTAVGCFAGAYFAHLYGWVGKTLFALDFTILPIAACVLGGSGTLVGPVVGALILTPLSELLRGFGQLRVVLYCLVLIGFIMFKPEGLMSWITRKYHQFEHWEEL